MGLRSRDFGEIAAGVYAANGISVWIQAESEVDALATPELSFIIRHLGAQGGLNVSASHNPPDDNGAKVYNYTGGQEVPPNDERMVKLVDQVDEVKRMNFDEAASSGLVKFFDHTAREAYRKAVLEVSLQPQLRDAVVVFTPLHGAGKSATARVLEEAGFHVHRVESQWGDDEGKFPNVPGRVANPEEPKAMIAAAKLAAEKGADIVLATDPDADRFGALVANGKGGFRYLDGNELATLVCHYVLDTRKRLGTLPGRPLAIKTEVTAAAITRIGEALGATVIDHLLVGFKYVGDIMRQIEDTGEFEGQKFELSDYLFGCEESHGCLVTTAIRDKDSAGPSLLIAELASECKQRGETVSDYLTEVYRKYGLTRNMQLSIGLAGATGAAQMQEMLTSLRQNPVSSVAGVGVTQMIDLQDESGRFGPIKSETDRVSRNVMLHPLENGCRIAVRPSGTEPKCKLYVEGSVNFENTEDFERVRDELDAKMIEVGEAFAAEMLERAGVNAADPGVKLAGVAEFEQKKDFDTFWQNAE
ncbi:MAG: phospho-sugar mutase [Verrucomicrobiota bacterium]